MEARTLPIRPEFLTVREAAIYLNCSEKTVRRFINRGFLRCIGIQVTLPAKHETSVGSPEAFDCKKLESKAGCLASLLPLLLLLLLLLLLQELFRFF
jgi:hypothetical protein